MNITEIYKEHLDGKLDATEEEATREQAKEETELQERIRAFQEWAGKNVKFFEALNSSKEAALSAAMDIAYTSLSLTTVIPLLVEARTLTRVINSIHKGQFE